MSSIHEQMRATRADQAQQRRDDRAQQAEIRRADRVEAREQERADQREREQQRQARRGAARARWAGRMNWLAARPVELVMSLIVAVPAVLAWSAMAAYGTEIYGPVGVGLPLFSEAGMWAFAFAAHRARRNERPTGWLLAGLWTFTGVAGLLNFLHGLAMPAGGITTGLVMALVSVGGVVAHQLITAGPMRSRRTWAQRRDAATARRAARRVVRMERAALRQAVGQLGTDGRVQLLHAPGTVTLRRGWTGRDRVERTTALGVGDDGPDPHGEDPAAALVGEVEAFLRDAPASPPQTPPAVPTEDAPDTEPEQRRDTPRTPRRTGRATNTRKARQPQHRTMTQLREQLRAAVADGQVDPTSAKSIREALRVGRERAQQLRDEWNDGSAGTPAPA